MDAQLAHNELDEIYTMDYESAYPLKSTRMCHVKTNGMIQNHGFNHDQRTRERKNKLHEFVKNKAQYEKQNAFRDKAKIEYLKTYFEKYKLNSRK